MWFYLLPWQFYSQDGCSICYNKKLWIKILILPFVNIYKQESNTFLIRLILCEVCFRIKTNKFIQYSKIKNIASISIFSKKIILLS